jgi:flagellum-specific ATP synthase
MWPLPLASPLSPVAPEILERAGPGAVKGGSITGVYAVLVEGDNHNEPVADAIRGTLDGHIVLDRAIAAAGRYPAVDILGSLSRLYHKALSPAEQAMAQTVRAMIARYEESRDLRALGGYTAGQDPTLDKAIDVVPKIYAVLGQSPASASQGDAIAMIARAAGLSTAN